MSFYIFFVYIKVFKNLLAKKIKIIKKVCERYQNLSKEGKEKKQLYGR